MIAGICTGSAPATKCIGGSGSGRSSVVSSHGEVHVRIGGLGDEHLGNGGVGGGLLHGLDAVGTAGQSVHLVHSDLGDAVVVGGVEQEVLGVAGDDGRTLHHTVIHELHAVAADNNVIDTAQSDTGAAAVHIQDAAASLISGGNALAVIGGNRLQIAHGQAGGAGSGSGLNGGDLTVHNSGEGPVGLAGRDIGLHAGAGGEHIVNGGSAVVLIAAIGNHKDSIAVGVAQIGNGIIAAIAMGVVHIPSVVAGDVSNTGVSGVAIGGVIDESGVGSGHHVLGSRNEVGTVVSVLGQEVGAVLGDHVVGIAAATTAHNIAGEAHATISISSTNRLLHGAGNLQLITGVGLGEGIEGIASHSAAGINSSRAQLGDVDDGGGAVSEDGLALLAVTSIARTNQIQGVGQVHNSFVGHGLDHIAALIQVEGGSLAPGLGLHVGNGLDTVDLGHLVLRAVDEDLVGVVGVSHLTGDGLALGQEVVGAVGVPQDIVILGQVLIAENVVGIDLGQTSHAGNGDGGHSTGGGDNGIGADLGHGVLGHSHVVVLAVVISILELDDSAALVIGGAQGRDQRGQSGVGAAAVLSHAVDVQGDAVLRVGSIAIHLVADVILVVLSHQVGNSGAVGDGGQNRAVDGPVRDDLAIVGIGVTLQTIQGLAVLGQLGEVLLSELQGVVAIAISCGTKVIGSSCSLDSDFLSLGLVDDGDIAHDDGGIVVILDHGSEHGVEGVQAGLLTGHSLGADKVVVAVIQAQAHSQLGNIDRPVAAGEALDGAVIAQGAQLHLLGTDSRSRYQQDGRCRHHSR